MPKTVKVACSKCKGTGVYVGGMEQKGEGRVCADCLGAAFLEMKVFSKRKRPKGIKFVTSELSGKLVYSDFLWFQRRAQNQ
jgi:DnaJ-class molecular chaperone